MEKYHLVSEFKGYNHKTDKTNLPEGFLVEGSRNVLTNMGERIMVRKGYTLDGQANSALTPIQSSYDWSRHNGDERHLRSYYDELEYRYVDSDNNVTWNQLKGGWGDAVNFNYAEFWNVDEQEDELLMVNGSSNIYSWSGAVATIASVTASTITKEGSETWGEEGFYTTGTRAVVIDGVEYTYTSGEGTDTLYGVTPDPMGSTIDQEQAIQNGTIAFGESDTTTKKNLVAQSFIPTDATLAGVELYKATNTGVPFGTTITVTIEADNAGVPSGTPLATATLAFGTYTLKPNGMYSLTFTPIAVTPGNTYWIKVASSTASDADHFNLGTNTAGGYASGEVKFFNTIDGWVPVATVDLFFRTLSAINPPVAGTVAVQAVRTTPNSAITGLPDTFENDLIGVLLNYIYIGSLVDRQVFMSQQNSYTDFSFSSPRLPGEGAIITLDGTPVGFISDEEFMYMSAGKNQWYRQTLQLGADQTVEALIIQRLKTTEQQAAQSQAFITKNKNSVIFISNEPTVSSLGRIELVQTPQTVDMSDPIEQDMNSYNFTNGCVAYFRNNLYVAVPAEGLVLIFNNERGWWEAPQILPIRRFAIIDGELYGHSANVPETYKLFDGINDNGAPIDAKAYFSYQQFGDRANQKYFNEFYNEGYISSNTQLTLRLLYDYKGSNQITEYVIDGSDQDILFTLEGDGSLGKQSIGKRSLAGRGDTEDALLPPKYRVIKTFPRTDFYELQVQYESVGEDQHWELLAWGPNVERSTALNVKIKQ